MARYSYVFRPIQTWPRKSETKGFAQKRAPFKATYSQTIDLLDDELRRAGAVGTVVIEVFLSADKIRMDGAMRADARPDKPGIILRFTGKHGAVTMPCDRYRDWHDNLRAIALTLESLRAIDRWGTTYSGEQYRGWTALPPAGGAEQMSLGDAATLLHKYAPFTTTDWIVSDVTAFRMAYRAAQEAAHPDKHGGTAEAVEEQKRVEEACNVLRQHHHLNV